MNTQFQIGDLAYLVDPNIIGVITHVSESQEVVVIQWLLDGEEETHWVDELEKVNV